MRTPAHGLIPGVFFHAAALSNLVNYDEGYFYKLNVTFEKILSVALIFLFSTLFVLGSGWLNGTVLSASTGDDTGRQAKNGIGADSDWLAGDRKKSIKAAALLLLTGGIIAIGFSLTFAFHADMIRLTVLALGHLGIMTAIHASGLYWILMRPFQFIFR